MKCAHVSLSPSVVRGFRTTAVQRCLNSQIVNPMTNYPRMAGLGISLQKPQAIKSLLAKVRSRSTDARGDCCQDVMISTVVQLQTLALTAVMSLDRRCLFQILSIRPARASWPSSQCHLVTLTACPPTTAQVAHNTSVHSLAPDRMVLSQALPPGYVGASAETCGGITRGSRRQYASGGVGGSWYHTQYRYAQGKLTQSRATIDQLLQTTAL